MKSAEKITAQSYFRITQKCGMSSKAIQLKCHYIFYIVASLKNIFVFTLGAKGSLREDVNTMVQVYLIRTETMVIKKPGKRNS